MKFIESAGENLKVELMAGGKSFAEVKIQGGIFQGHALLQFLFVVTMMPLNHILTKCAGGIKLSKSQEKIHHLIYTDYIKLFPKNEKVLETLKQAVRT